MSAALVHSTPCSAAPARSPWPPLDQLRGKLLAVLVLGGGSPEAAALQEAFPDLREWAGAGLGGWCGRLASPACHKL